MIPRLAKIGMFAFCAVMTAWLIRYEAFPGYFADSFAGYRSLFSDGTLLVDNWIKISYQGAPIGYSYTRMAAPDDDPGEATRIENRTTLQIKVLGVPQRVNATLAAALDAAHRLKRFNFVLSSKQYTAQIEGDRVDGETFDVTIHTAAGASTTQIKIPDDVIIYSPLTELALRKLRPGQKLRIKTLDPVSMRTVAVVCEAVRRETIVHSGVEVPATLLTMSYQGMTISSWMNDQGKVIRQETPLGWVMEACTQDEAMSLDLDAETMQDMILASAVPLEGTIRAPKESRSLRLRLNGLHLDPEGLRSFRQDVVPSGEASAEVTLYARDLPVSGVPRGMAGAGMEEFLASSPFVQSDHPDIRSRAEQIVGSATDSLEAALRLNAWVDKKVENNPTVSLPSALDVLQERVGDCNEHTYLYVALARSIGLPARIRVGLVFHQGAFYYHAWPAVYVGEWVEMDPTLGQDSVDATHLALLEGELANQLELMKVMGRLNAEVLEERPRPENMIEVGE
jgi:hypothetical protein